MGATGTGNTASHTFTTVAGSDAGRYKVIFSDGSGNTVSTRTATLTISAALPKITTQPTNKRVASGGDLSLRAVGSGFASWKWQKDGTDISGATGTSSPIRYTKTGVDAGDAGTYKVVLTNSDGGETASNDATVTIT